MMNDRYRNVVECKNKVTNGKRVAWIIRALVNAKELNLECVQKAGIEEY